MGMLNIEKISKDVVERNRALFEQMGLLEPSAPPPATPVPDEPAGARKGPPRAGKRHYSKGAEKKLQEECHKWLAGRGYVYLTNTNAAEKAATAKYWFGHLAKPQGNAFMPDIFIFGCRSRRCLMVELKTHNVYQVGQKEMVEAGNWVLATSKEEFAQIVEAWEKIVEQEENFLLPGTGTGARE